MDKTRAEDVARILAALLDAQAWFRHGATDQDIAQRSRLPIARVILARRAAEELGLVERHGIGTPSPQTSLTPSGVARAYTYPVAVAE